MASLGLPRVASGLLLLCVAAGGAGCAGGPAGGNPYAQNAGPNSAAAQATAPLQAQLQDAQRRIAELDANNRDLHAQMAKVQQQTTLYKDQLSLVQQRLQETAAQLQQADVARKEVEQQAATLQASVRRPGGATITANNSVRQALEVVEIPGLNVRAEGDVIRIEVPADQLFVAGTAQFTASSGALLDRIADALRRHYPRQRIGIEGHTDSGSAGISASQAASKHHLAASQAQGVFEHLTQRGGLPARQLFVVAHGDNYPRASNATAAGRAANRRLEIVVYPESYMGG